MRALFALFLVAIIVVSGTAALVILIYNLTVMVRNAFF